MVVGRMLLFRRTVAAAKHVGRTLKRRSLPSFSSVVEPPREYLGPKAFGSFHLGTIEYAECFQDLPNPDPTEFRTQALDYLDTKFNAQKWYTDPVCSVLNGVVLPEETGTTVVDTVSGLGHVNGKQIYASPSQLQAIASHIMSYKSRYTDCRDLIRSVEQDLLTNQSGELIGNQCMDFGKQDGVTEIVEMISACVVERRLNDYLVLEEKLGRLTVNRLPIYVSIVSNFSNFLDLSRKTLRSLEVGIPVVILGRTNHTQQHSYRWTQLLMEQCTAKGLDPGMITFVSCGLPELKTLLQTCQVGNLYMTGSRDLAKSIKSIYPNTIASTGGPNTMVICNPVHENPVDPQVAMLEAQALLEKAAAEGGEVDPNTAAEETRKQKKKALQEWLSPELKKAIQLSASIESSGQCTALRHVIIPPGLTEADLSGILASTPVIESPKEALRQEHCDGVLVHDGTPPPPSSADYKADAQTQGRTYWKVNEELPSGNLPECWRQVVVDYTKLETNNYEYTDIDKLAHWLNTTQPISLAVNGNMVDSYKTMKRLFDRTALAVYTVGGIDSELIHTNPAPKVLPPALTCQARPQEGELFGEVPPRNQLQQYTKFPVYIPSSNPSYDTTYALPYLHEKAKSPTATSWNTSSKALLTAIANPAVQGFCMLLVDYLRNVDDDNPKITMTSANRTVLYGLQRPPLQTMTVLRVNADDEHWWDACAPAVLLFHVTNARDQFQLSIPAAGANRADQEAFCLARKLPYIVETDTALEQRVAEDTAKAHESTIFQVVPLNSMEHFPMVGQYTSLFFPMGHIKSTAPQDVEFIDRMRHVSRKWIQTLF